MSTRTLIQRMIGSTFLICDVFGFYWNRYGCPIFRVYFAKKLG